MKSYTFNSGRISAGFALQQHEKFGQHVFLGEEGRGRSWERLGLDRYNAPAVSENRVFDCNLRKVEPKEDAEKKFRPFWVLVEDKSGDEDAILVHVNSRGTYTRGCGGGWKVHEGNPETIVSGYGAHGQAGRLAGWQDGIVKMQPGDVLYVITEGGSKTNNYALYIEDGEPKAMRWEDWKVHSALQSTAEQKPEAVFSRIPFYTRNRGQFELGVRVGKGTTGPAVVVGESGRGRRQVELPLVGIEADGSITHAAVGRVDELHCLTNGDVDQSKAFAVRIQVGGGGRGHYSVEKMTGEPVSIASGRYASGDAGRAGSGPDAIWVLRPGDELLIGCGGDPRTVVANENGKPVERDWFKTEKPQIIVKPDGVITLSFWSSNRRRRAGISNQISGTPMELLQGGAISGGTFYATESYNLVQTDRATSRTYSHASEVKVGHRSLGSMSLDDVRQLCVSAFRTEQSVRPSQVSTEWVGRVVQVVLGSDDNFRWAVEGELVSVDPFVVNLGWNGQDRKEQTITDGVWVTLDPSKTVRRLSGVEEESRSQAKASAAALLSEIRGVTNTPHFDCLDESFRDEVHEFISEAPTSYDGMRTEELESWISSVRHFLDRVRSAEVSAKELHSRREAGETLVDFGGHFRRMGMSSNGDYWVIYPDGSLREPDEIDYRKRYTSEGKKLWRRIGAEELALEWHCGSMRDVRGGSNFTVAKLPVSGVTEQQLERVRQIETEDIDTERGVFGLDPELNVQAGQLLGEIAEAFPTCPACGETIDWNDDAYQGVVGSNGFICCSGSEARRAVDWNKPWEASCHSRDAQVTESRRVSGGVVEALFFEKWGDDNLALRYRECDDLPDDESQDDDSTANPADVSGLDLSKLFGGRAKVNRPQG